MKERPEKIEADVLAESLPLSHRVTSAFRRTFASLGHRDFRIFWAGAWFSNIGTWLQSVAVGWLVLEMTDSTLYLGLVSFAASVPVFLLSFTAGIYADRLNKRRLILWSQTTLMLLAFLLGALVSLDVHTVWSIIAIGFLAGIAGTFSFPAWQSIIAEIVPRKDLHNAIALNSLQFQSARFLGPTMAGFVIAAWGTAACFYLNGASFLTVIAGLLLMRHHGEQRDARRSGWEEFKEGLAYIRANRVVLYLLGGVGVMSVFGLTFYAVLMPKFARDVLHGDARTLGLLMGGNGFGAVVGALTVAYISYAVRRSTIIKWGAMGFSLAAMTFAFSTSVWLSMGALVAAGFTALAVFSTLNTSIQTIVPQAIRGRIMSFFVWMFLGWMPLGSLLAGFMADRLGAPAAVGLAAAVPLALSLYLILALPSAEVPAALEEKGP